MAKYVREIMNSELFSVEPDAPRQDTLDFLLLTGITGCPVIDEAGKVLGMVTLRDLVPEVGGNRMRRRISEPAVTVDLDATIEEAAEKLAEYHTHRLLVLDAKGTAVGIVSAVDLVAALVGAPVIHPRGLPRTSSDGRVIWSYDAALEPESSEQVPNAPGVLVLIYGHAGQEEVPVWVEQAQNLRARVDDLLSAPQETPVLAHILQRDHGHLRFRTATIPDDMIRAQAVADLQRALRQRLSPRV